MSAKTRGAFSLTRTSPIICEQRARLGGLVSAQVIGLVRFRGWHMRRLFSRREKNALYLAQDGKCALCGASLDDGWHADHIDPYSHGGETDITNGQALCPTCNLKKGNKVTKHTITPRRFQQEFIDVALEKARRREKVLVANVHPGSGKTLAALMAADKLKSMGYIDAVIVFVPRLNLAAQFENDWTEASHNLVWEPVLQAIEHRKNTPPLIRRGADGYVTTYDSLTSDPAIHVREVAKHKTLVIFDEAQQLGVDYDGTKQTQSALEAAKIGERATMIMVLSGTPERADGSPLLFAKYAEPDERGYCKLQADIDYTYLDGVRDGILRPFEVFLHDGVSVWQALGAQPEQLVLSEIERAIYRIIREPGYWKPLVDNFVEALEEQRRDIDPRLCGLVAAYDQKHAKEIAGYLKKKHGHLHTIVAVSDDGSEAHKALREFRQGKADVLVTVNMAYVGYDHKPISVILPLTGYRTQGYLRQLFARGMRVMSDIDADSQWCKVIAPDDKFMREFTDVLRRESESGMLQRKEEWTRREGQSGGIQQEIGAALDAWVTAIRARGIDPTGDLNDAELREAERLRKEMRIPVAITQLFAFMRAWQDLTPVNRQVTGTYTPTQQEREKAARQQLQKINAQCDHALANHVLGSTNKLMIRYYNKPVEQCTLSEIEDRIRKAKRWLEQGYYD